MATYYCLLLPSAAVAAAPHPGVTCGVEGMWPLVSHSLGSDGATCPACGQQVVVDQDVCGLTWSSGFGLSQDLPLVLYAPRHDKPGANLGEGGGTRWHGIGGATGPKTSSGKFG